MKKYEIIYIRFRNIPKNNISKNYLNNKFEQGLSVYEAIIKNNKIHLIVPNHRTNSLVTMSGFFDEESPTFQVSGKRIGYGSDGEPLLTNIKIIRKLKWRNNNVVLD